MGEQRGRLRAGECYLDGEELQGLRRRCWQRLDAFNNAPAEADGERDQILRGLLGGVGADVVVMARFHCS